MKRRTFLQRSGLVGAAALWGGGQALAADSPPHVTPEITEVSMDSLLRSRDELLHRRNQNRSTVCAANGMVCASQPLATLAGLDMLRAGGSAIDAAIAANAMLSLVEPMSCGPGGDLFAIVWDEAEGKLHGLNASGRAPFDWSLAEAGKLGLTRIPGQDALSWSVPGCVSGWQKLHEKWGKLALEQVFAPVVRYAREGFPLSPVIAFAWGIDAARFPTLAEAFLPEGSPLAFGDMATNPQLAGFYECLLRDGLPGFYHGEIAARIVQFSQANGGRFSMRDFTEHEANWVEPVSANYRGYDVWELPPNGQGIAALQIMNLLEHFDIGTLAPNSAEHLHLFIEAKKLAYEDRAKYYADPAFADVPVQQLISKDYAAERVKRIDPKRAAVDVPAGKPLGGDTVYLTAADSDGNMVSFIQSIYAAWGSHIVPGKLGFALQNRGQSFALDPNHPNRLEPHKRPFHTIIPAFVTKEGRPAFSFGVMGGDFQPQGHAQVLMNWIDFGMSPQQAGESPRAEHDGSSTPTGGPQSRRGGTVTCEQGIGESVRDALRAMGHEVARSDGMHGGYQSILRLEEPRRCFGGSDPRKDGCAMGY